MEPAGGEVSRALKRRGLVVPAGLPSPVPSASAGTSQPAWFAKTINASVCSSEGFARFASFSALAGMVCQNHQRIGL
jgi:hypothetical protein